MLIFTVLLITAAVLILAAIYWAVRHESTAKKVADDISEVEKKIGE